MKRDDDPQLWDLLGHSAEPEVSPFFARKVLREIRETGDWNLFRGWLSPRRLIPLAGLAAIMISAVSFLPPKSKVAPLAEPLSDTIATIEAIDYEIIADLEDLLGSEESIGLEETGSP